MNKTPNKLSEAQRIEARRAQQRRYYNANKRRFKNYYKDNKKARDAYQVMHRELDRAAYLLKQKQYNNGKRKQRPEQG